MRSLQNEFTKRMEELSSNILVTMTTLLRRASYIIVNQSSVPVLFKRVVQGEGSTNARVLERAEAAQSLLRVMAKHAPALFKAHMGELCKLTADEDKGVAVELAVMALANVVKWDAKIGGNVDKCVYIPSPFLSRSSLILTLACSIFIERRTNGFSDSRWTRIGGRLSSPPDILPFARTRTTFVPNSLRYVKNPPPKKNTNEIPN